MLPTLEFGWSHWAVAGAPFVALAGVAVFWLIHRRSNRPPHDNALHLH